MDDYARLWTVPDIDPKWSMRWYWWFWVVFLDDPAETARPRQLMVLWTYKEAATLFNDMLVLPEDGIKNGSGRESFPGVVAAWYFDGERMDPELAFERGTLTAEHNADDPCNGRLSFESAVGNECAFSGQPRDWRLRLRNEKVDVDVSLRLDEPASFTRPSHIRNRIVAKRFMYSALELNRCTAAGTIDGEQVKGTAYFQRIGLNSPMGPWYWGVFHFADGSVLKYFFPHVSTSAFRHDPAERLPWHERWLLPARRQAEFYHAPTDTTHTFSRGTVEKELDADGLPTWRLRVHDDTTHLDATLDSYARVVWRFRPHRPRLPLNDMYYNEYPTQITAFTLDGPDGRLTLDDLGPGVGNTEHTWGGLV
ncbi:MAG: hypothetical protein QF415_02695 [Candidatus Undinarchaeales archaeon]|jgi:hypothetical protein|nr:hypothetical protein [Candidatus Undinarchaeales archaeon]MDP7492732.1 hypothetical protein [Candidatus Undinarchaeales archaeon]